MSSNSKWSDWRDVQRKVSMSEKAGRNLPFMKETACVHVEEREMIAWVESYGLICPTDKKFKAWLEKVAKPVLMKVGRSRWYRDTITDLGFALASKGKDKSQTQDAKDILKEDVKE